MKTPTNLTPALTAELEDVLDYDIDTIEDAIAQLTDLSELAVDNIRQCEDFLKDLGTRHAPKRREASRKEIAEETENLRHYSDLIRHLESYL